MATTVSTIRFTFEGMLALFIKHGRPRCNVAFLSYAPDHVADILITEISNGGAPQTLEHLTADLIAPRLWLDVQRPLRPGIQLFTPPDTARLKFDRGADTGDPSDFRWAIDFEGQEFYVGPIGADASAFKAFLRINSATFFTQTKSDNKLK